MISLDIPAKNPTLILHIGGPKCGSSALQTFLTQNPKLKHLDGRTVEYWTVSSGGNGELEPSFTPVLRRNYSKGLRYTNSQTSPEEFKTSCIHSLFDKFVLENDEKKNKVFIFSMERWSRDFQKTEVTKCVCKKNYEIIIYLSVRPQIDILIPAYLQWTIWNENPTLESTFEMITQFADWERQFQNAHKLGADKVDVRYTRNIVEDFCNLYKIKQTLIKQPATRIINKSLPIEAISLLSRNRVLRPGPHDSFIDFLIEDYISEFNIETKPVIARIPRELIDSVDNYFQLCNLKLFETMDQNQMLDFKSKCSSIMNQAPVGIEIEDLSSNHLTIEFLEPLATGLLADFQKFKGERDQALMARDQALMARDQALMARDQALMARDQIEKSRIWRYSRGYRFIRNLLR